ncbi:MAG: phosphatidylinositol-specific phospholipase C domain-containing protein [Methylophagaceae bacterium]
MSFFDVLPVVSQIKSLGQWIAGDSEGAKATQEAFSKGFPGISQLRSGVEAAMGDFDAARKTQEEFLHNDLENLPGVSQIISAGYAISGDTDEAKRIQQQFLDQNIKTFQELASLSFLSSYHRLATSRSLKSRADWMGHCQDMKLHNMLIPGSHDTTTYRFRDAAVATLWAQTQQLTIYEQLMGGVRYLDIRIGTSDNEIYCYHGHFPTVLFGTVLNDIKKFLKVAGKNEVVLLAVRIATGQKIANWTDVDNAVNTKLKDRLIAQSMVNSTVGEMTAPAKSKPDITRNVLYGKGEPAKFGHSLKIINSWNETKSRDSLQVVSKCREFARKQKRQSGQLILLAAQATPFEKETPRSVYNSIRSFGEGLEFLATISNWAIKSAMLSDIRVIQGTNIISMDFVNDQIIEQIVLQNNLCDTGFDSFNEIAGLPSLHLKSGKNSLVLRGRSVSFLANWNDSITSFDARIGKWIFYKDKNYHGIDDHVWDVSGPYEGKHDKPDFSIGEVSSIRSVPTSGIALFSGKMYQRTMLVISGEPPTKDASKNKDKSNPEYFEGSGPFSLIDLGVDRFTHKDEGRDVPFDVNSLIVCDHAWGLFCRPNTQSGRKLGLKVKGNNQSVTFGDYSVYLSPGKKIENLPNFVTEQLGSGWEACSLVAHDQKLSEHSWCGDYEHQPIENEIDQGRIHYSDSTYKDLIWTDFTGVRTKLKLDHKTGRLTIVNNNPKHTPKDDVEFIANWGRRSLKGFTYAGAFYKKVSQQRWFDPEVTESTQYFKGPLRKKCWMTDLYPIIKDKTLSEITLPGTHNSGAYKRSKEEVIHGYVENLTGQPIPHSLTKAPPTAQSYIDKVARGEARLDLGKVKALIAAMKSQPKFDPIMHKESVKAASMDSIEKWAKTQSMSVLEQLHGGIRFLDLRAAEFDDGIYLYHGFIGPKLSDVLEDVKTFLNENHDGNELVILYFSHFFGKKESLINLIESLLGNNVKRPNNDGKYLFNNKAIGKGGLGSCTVSQLVGYTSRALVIGEAGPQGINDHFPGDINMPVLQDAYSYHELRDSAHKEVKDWIKADSQITVLPWVIRPSRLNVAKALLHLAPTNIGVNVAKQPHSLLQLSEQCNRNLHEFVEYDRYARMNVLLVNFFENSSVVELAIERSRKL